MNILTEKQLITRLQFTLDKFKEHKTPNTADKFNFRCPICGDSAKSKSKARAWLSVYKDHYNFHCFNCSESMSLKNFLKTIGSPLQSEFQLTSFTLDSKPKRNTNISKIKHIPKTNFKKRLMQNQSLSKLPTDHYAIEYVNSRLIPKKYHDVLGHTDNFKLFINTIVPNYFESTEYDEPRLIIPFYNADNSLIAVQGRAYGPSKLRYITIKIDENTNKYFGLDRVNFNKTTYLLEGPIDSLFLPNAIAMAGASFDFNSMEKYKKNLIIIYDNEPRNPQIVNHIKSALIKGYKCTIWPSHGTKDINDMILNNINAKQIKKLINDNTYSGMLGILKLNDWKRT